MKRKRSIKQWLIEKVFFREGYCVYHRKRGYPKKYVIPWSEYHYRIDNNIPLRESFADEYKRMHGKEFQLDEDQLRALKSLSRSSIK